MVLVPKWHGRCIARLQEVASKAVQLAEKGQRPPRLRASVSNGREGLTKRSEKGGLSGLAPRAGQSE